MMSINLAFSPCPNDTFIFDALVHGKIDTEGLAFDYRMEDVETLNHLAMTGSPDMVKVSYHAFLYLSDKYVLLDSGSAMGTGNGPLLISKNRIEWKDVSHLTVAVPGEYTTAHLLLKLTVPPFRYKKIMVFNRIEDAVLDGTADAGVIIHENRFTYERKGLVKIADLGELYQDLAHCPVPLGGIIVKKSLGEETIGRLNRVMKRSVEFAMRNEDQAMDFVRCNAQEMDEDVMRKHIHLYVNDFTPDMGIRGKNAIATLFELAKSRGLVQVMRDE